MAGGLFLLISIVLALGVAGAKRGDPKAAFIRGLFLWVPLYLVCWGVPTSGVGFVVGAALALTFSAVSGMFAGP